MGMGIGPVAVVAAAPAGKSQLQDLAQFLQQIHGLIDGGQAGGGEIHPHLLKDLLHAGMVPALGQDLQDCQALGGHPVASLPEGREHMIQALLRVCHFIYYFRLVTCLGPEALFAKAYLLIIIINNILAYYREGVKYDFE
jgi:hypothetical protein